MTYFQEKIILTQNELKNMLQDAHRHGFDWGSSGTEKKYEYFYFDGVLEELPTKVKLFLEDN